MAIAIVGSVGGIYTSATTSITQAFDATGADYLVAVAQITSNTVNPVVGNITATFNSVAMTNLAFKLQDAEQRAVGIWGLVAPAQGSYNLVLSDTVDETVYWKLGIYALSGVHQTTPAGTGGGTSFPYNQTTVSVSLSSATGELVLDIMYSHSDAGAITATGTDQTRRLHESGYFASSSMLGTATVVPAYSFGAGSYGAMAAVPIKPAAGGGATGLMWLH
jgi:hypothetical protein